MVNNLEIIQNFHLFYLRAGLLHMSKIALSKLVMLIIVDINQVS